VIITTWRIFLPRFRSTAFTGLGAKLHGGRWNSKGTAVIYTSRSAALAQLELLVHLQSDDILKRYVLRSCAFENSLVRAVDLASLPSRWRANPPPPALRAIGDGWAASLDSAVLAVPSVFGPRDAIIADEMNFPLNPLHPDFKAITLGPEIPIRLDRRLKRI
jgi:RES domain-containing protein